MTNRSLGLWVTLAGSLLAACSGSDGAKGDKGDPGAAGTGGAGSVDPSAGLVVPHVGLLDRETDVVVTADALKLDAQTQLDFGAGVTVSNIQVASSSTVLAHLKIDAAAAVGPRDVKITASGTTVTGAKSFEVLPPLDVKVSDGSAEQGGIVVVDVVNRDTTAFDTAQGSFVLLGDGLNPLGGSVTATNAQQLLLVDPLGKVGDQQLTAANIDQAGKPAATFLSASDALKVAARAPTGLTSGTALGAESFAGGYATKMYKISAPAPGATAASIVSVVFKTTATDKTNPIIWAMPSSGKMSDLVMTVQPAQANPLFGTPGDVPPYTLPVVLPIPANGAATDLYLVALDLGSGSGNKFSIEPTVVAAKSVTEQNTAHATKAAAQPLIGATNSCGAAAASFGPCVVSAGFAAKDEVDVYTVSLPAAGKLEAAFTPESAGATLGIFDGAGASVDLNNADTLVYTQNGETSAVGKSTISKTNFLVVVQGDKASKYNFSLRVAP